jgi:hypothetical protein
LEKNWHGIRKVYDTTSFALSIESGKEAQKDFCASLLLGGGYTHSVVSLKNSQRNQRPNRAPSISRTGDFCASLRIRESLHGKNKRNYVNKSING